MITSVPDIFARSIAVSTASTATYNVGDVIDTGGDGINDVSQLVLDIIVDTAFTSADSTATVRFQLVSDTTASISTTTQKVHAESGSFLVTALVAGFRAWLLSLPKDTYRRYLGVQAVVGVEALTAGKIDAFLTPAGTTWTPFPAGI